MGLQISFLRAAVIVIIAGLATSAVFVFFPTFDWRGESSFAMTIAPAGTEPMPSSTGAISAESAQNIDLAEQPRAGLPVRLIIPKIKVDADLERVGLTADGAVDTPKNQNDAAWFELGPRPGENGGAVITGHYGWKDNKPSAFDNLYKLRVGDRLFTEDEAGATTAFVVRETKRYESDAATTDVFGPNDGKPHLNLITCEGTWDKAAQSYSNRLVVFTDEEAG